jgi:hypothetical protein
MVWRYVIGTLGENTNSCDWRTLLAANTEPRRRALSKASVDGFSLGSITHCGSVAQCRTSSMTARHRSQELPQYSVS